MDHVQRTNIDNDRLAYRDDQIFGHDKILLIVRIVLVQSERIVSGDKLPVLSGKDAVGVGIPAVPLKLLSDDFNDGGILLLGKLIDGMGPNIPSIKATTPSK